MKRRVEQINIWWSKTTGQWITCAWLPFELDHYYRTEECYTKERVAHYSLEAAMAYIKEHYKEEK